MVENGYLMEVIYRELLTSRLDVCTYNRRALEGGVSEREVVRSAPVVQGRVRAFCTTIWR
jgi:hypothetical protein